MNDLDLPVGVSSEDLQTISIAGITPSAINTAGLEGYFERGYDGVSLLESVNDAAVMFGRFRSSYHGMYGLKGLFDELAGESARVYVSRLVPSDAVAASVSIDNIASTPHPSWKLSAGRKGYVDKGAWGNQLWVTLTDSSRADSVLTVATTATDTTVTVASTTQFELYDYVTIGTTVLQIIGIDEQDNVLTLSGQVGAINAIDAVVAVRDITIELYIKDSDTGVVSDPVIYPNLTIDPRSRFYWESVLNDPFLGSDYLFAEQLVNAENDTFEDFPETTASGFANAIHLTGGVNGTALTSTDMASARERFNPYGIRYLCNMESQSKAVYLDGEAYCNKRKDCVWVGTVDYTTSLTYGATFAHATTLQRTRKVFAWNSPHWFYVADPLSSTGALKAIPNVGHRIGYAIRFTTLYGIHTVIAARTAPFLSVRGLVSEFVDDTQIRNLTNIGMNCMTDDNGEIVLRSGRTPSKLREWTFINAVNMATYFKLSFTQSLKSFENKTNNDELLNSIVGSMKDFAYDFYTGSSNGGNEGGFASGSFTEVTRFDYGPSINKRQSIQNGVLRVYFYFIPPAPAERIRVGVGQMSFQVGAGG